MKKTNPKILEEIIRVDHAGERGAIKIYEGQLLALKTIKQDKLLQSTVEKMKDQETDNANNEVVQYRQPNAIVSAERNMNYTEIMILCYI